MPRSGHRRARWHGTGTPRFLLRRHGAIRIPGTHRTRADTPRFHMVERWSDDVDTLAVGRAATRAGTAPGQLRGPAGPCRARPGPGTPATAPASAGPASRPAPSPRSRTADP